MLSDRCGYFLPEIGVEYHKNGKIKDKKIKDKQISSQDERTL
jgi:hypothetical protein